MAVHIERLVHVRVCVAVEPRDQLRELLVGRRVAVEDRDAAPAESERLKGVGVVRALLPQVDDVRHAPLAEVGVLVDEQVGANEEPGRDAIDTASQLAAIERLLLAAEPPQQPTNAAHPAPPSATGSYLA